MQPLYLKLAFPLLLAAAAHGATLPSLVQTRFKLHTGPTQQRVHKGSVLSSNWRALAQAAPPAEVEEGVSMPLVSIEPSNQTLQIHPTALQALARAPAPVCVLGVTGTARYNRQNAPPPPPCRFPASVWRHCDPHAPSSRP